MAGKAANPLTCDANVLLDSGATHCFVSTRLVKRAGLKTRETPGMFVEVAGGSSVSCGQTATLTLRLGMDHTETLTAHVMSDVLQGVDLILGDDWLRKHNALLDYGNRTCNFVSAGRKVVLRSRAPVVPFILTAAALAKAELMTAKQAARMLRKGAPGVLLLIQRRKDVLPEQPSMQSQEGSSVSARSPADGASCGSVCATAAADAHVPPEIKARLTALLERFTDVFAELKSLPPERQVGHTIPLMEGARPPFTRPRKLSKLEDEELVKQIKDFIERGWIEPGCSPYGAPVLFAPKKDGSLRLCIDYRQLNKITIRDRFPLPRIDDLFDKLHGKCYFSSLDLQAGYHQIRIRPEDVPKTAFVTPHGQYQYRVLPMGLTNAPATFQREMNSIFHDMLGKHLLVYLDDLLIMSSSVEEHLKHLEGVLQRLREHKYHAKLKKCEFLQTQIKFLGHLISAEGVRPDPAKIEAIVNWPRPRNLVELQGFLGMANYMRKHILGYSILAGPLTRLTGKLEAAKFDWQNWDVETICAFEAVKQAVSQAALLAHPDLNGTFEVRADASLDGLGAILMQQSRPIAFLSKKFSRAERNYTTGEQELLALVSACKEWRCYLESSDPFTLVTDHQPLTFLGTQEQLSRRQARWLEFLARFKYEIVYKPGVENPADPLSRKPVVAIMYARLAATTRAQRKGAEGSKGGEETAEPVRPAKTSAEPVVPAKSKGKGRGRGKAADDVPPVAVPPTVPTNATDVPAQPPLPPGHPSTLLSELTAGYESDPDFSRPEITDTLERGDDGLWRLPGSGLVVVPDGPVREQILSLMHDAAWSGHVGFTKTLENVRRLFWWQSMRVDVRNYVANCDACQRNKASNQKPAGLLQPLSVPGWRWESVSMDHITKLPKTDKGYDSICVFVDRLSKMVHLVPCMETDTASDFARLFVDNVFRLHGMPREVITDRGTVFNNMFWDCLCELLQVKQCKSTAYHPQSDGQTERYNRVLEEMLRHYIAPDCKDWDKHLSCAEFAINNSWQESVRSTPFLINYGQSPLTPVWVALPNTRVRAPSAQHFAERWQELVRRARMYMKMAQERMAKEANRHRRDVEFAVGQHVLLSTRNLKLKAGMSCRKLLPRYIGPFPVRRLVGRVAVELDLPFNMRKLHPVFHVSLLKPYVQSRERALQRCVPPPVDWLDDEPVYRVEQLLNHRERRYGGRKRVEYLIKWEGYAMEHNTWEPRSNLLTCDSLLRAYHRAKGLPLPEGVASDSDDDSMSDDDE